jgi:hypothetical protein
VSTRRTDHPAPLVVAASLVAVEGVVLLALAILELASLSSQRVTMGVTTAGFFVVYGAALLLCAWVVHRGHSWARSPIVLAQLIQLGLAWNFWGGSTTPIAVGLAVVAVVVVLGLFHPASLDALADDPS